ncbi:hydrogenase 4 subunit H [Escherichia coli]|nr:hydrogenase 4 subunit H [Escherichia coli]EKY5819188.1 hydrogenase 4 subunit H [Escherichia coli]
MLKLLKTIMRAGGPTVKYPFAPLDVCPGFRGKPELNPRQCIACGACMTACPANALTMETHTEKDISIWQLYLGRCIYCGRCEEVCPTHAIQLSENFELAVTRKEDLYTRAVFRLQHCSICQSPFAPQKSVELAAELLTRSQNTPQNLNILRQQINICPKCRQYAALACSDNQNISFFAKENL